VSVCLSLPAVLMPFLLSMSNRVHIQNVPGVKITTSGFNSRADSESKRHTHMGPIRNGSGVMSFKIQ
jgi:hypothetical protein